MKKTVQKIVLGGGMGFYAWPALAADGAAASGLAWMPLLGTLVYSLVGLLILLVAFKVFDIFTPYNLHKELAEDQNTALGVMMAGVFVALAIIIAASIT